MLKNTLHENKFKENPFNCEADIGANASKKQFERMMRTSVLNKKRLSRPSSKAVSVSKEINSQCGS